MPGAKARRETGRQKLFAMYREGRPVSRGPGEDLMNVLIADDDPRFRAVVRNLLEAKPRMGTVWEAADGEEAVRYARALSPDVILIDVAMPRINGLEATRLIKAAQPEIPVIICSVHNEPIFRRVASLNGADEFLSKSSFPMGLDLIDRVVQEDRTWAEKRIGRE